MDRVELLVEKHEMRMRLEDFLCSRFSGLSKMYLREVVKDEQCEVNGRAVNIGHRLRPNDFVELNVELEREYAMLPQPIPIDVVYEDEHLIVINKPHGMLVHPSHREKIGTLLNAVVFHINQERDGREMIRPGLIHRLDRQTSGLIVIAKDAKTHRSLSKQFQLRKVTKNYRALVDGGVRSQMGIISGKIGRYPEEKRWGIRTDGKSSTTRFTVVKTFEDATLLELVPVTGRTNQLRIHCEAIGHPVRGDESRGGKPYERLCLHSSRLGFTHPATNEWMVFEAEIEF